MATRRSTIHGYLALCNGIYWLALTVWVGALITAAIAATSTFTTLPDPSLGVTLERFAAFDETQHGRIAAGKVMEPVFFTVDVMQAAAGLFVVVMLVLQLTLFRLPWRSVSNLLRTLCIGVAVGLFAGRAFTIMPEMNHNLRSYWQAAEAGETERAMTHREAFDAHHGTASALFQWTLVSLIVAVGASAVALGPGRLGNDTPQLEKPRLSR